MGIWISETAGRLQAGSLLLFGVWEIFSSLLPVKTKLIALEALVALTALSLASAAAEPVLAVCTTLLVLSILLWLLSLGI